MESSQPQNCAEEEQQKTNIARKNKKFPEMSYILLQFFACVSLDLSLNDESSQFTSRAVVSLGGFTEILNRFLI